MTKQDFLNEYNLEINELLTPFIRTVIKSGSINVTRLKKFNVEVKTYKAESGNDIFQVLHNGESISPKIEIDLKEFLQNQIDHIDTNIKRKDYIVPRI